MNVSALDSEGLRTAMVDRLVAEQAAKGLALPTEVEAAMRKVPRDLFTPGVGLEEAYADSAVVTKRRGEESISSVSAPFLIAEMLTQAVEALGGLADWDVLEIGSGGYNASLLSELVGPKGSVTTVDIDPDVTSRATACLTNAGYPDVTVVCADGEHPIRQERRFDLIIVTAGAWDVPPAWRDQLRAGGVLVVPLRTFGMTRAWALRRDGDRLVSVSQRQCGFVPMQGEGAHDIRYVDVADGVHLRLDEGQQIDSAALVGLLDTPRADAWADASLPPRTLLSDLDLWLAAHLSPEVEEFVVLSAQETAVESGTISPSWRFGTPATLDEGSFAYRSALRWTDGKFDLGAYAHGPAAQGAADRMVQQMRGWLDAGQPAPALYVLPAMTPDGDLPAGTVLDKRHSRLVLTFTTDSKEPS